MMPPSEIYGGREEQKLADELKFRELNERRECAQDGGRAERERLAVAHLLLTDGTTHLWDLVRSSRGIPMPCRMSRTGQ